MLATDGARQSACGTDRFYLQLLDSVYGSQSVITKWPFRDDIVGNPEAK